MAGNPMQPGWNSNFLTEAQGLELQRRSQGSVAPNLTRAQATLAASTRPEPPGLWESLNTRPAPADRPDFGALMTQHSQATSRLPCPYRATQETIDELNQLLAATGWMAPPMGETYEEFRDRTMGRGRTWNSTTHTSRIADKIWRLAWPIPTLGGGPEGYFAYQAYVPGRVVHPWERWSG